MQRRTRAVAHAAAALGTALLFAAVRLQPLRNADLLWQVATGERILAARSLVREDLFSAAFRGAPVHDHEPLSEALLAWLHRIGGFRCLWWIGFFVAIVVALIAYRMAARIAEGAGARLVAAAIVAVGISPRFELRAEWAGFLAVGVAHALRRDLERGRFRRYAPLLVAAIAAPFHSFAVFVALVPLAHAAERERGFAIDLGVAAAIPLVVHLIAPHALPNFAAHLASPTFTEHVIEYYSPIRFVIASGDPAPLLAIAAALIGAVGLWSRVRTGRAKRADVFLLAALTVPAFVRVRFTALPVLAMLPWIVGGLAAFFEKLLARASAIARGGALTVVVALAVTYITRFLGLEPVVGFDWETQPVEAVAFLRERRPNAVLFHPLNFGSYLIYTRYPPRGVVIDARGATVYPESYVRAYYDALADDAGFVACLDRGGYDTVLLHRRHKGTANVRARMYASPQWRVGWEDTFAVVFVRK